VAASQPSPNFDWFAAPNSSVATRHLGRSRELFVLLRVLRVDVVVIGPTSRATMLLRRASLGRPSGGSVRTPDRALRPHGSHPDLCLCSRPDPTTGRPRHTTDRDVGHLHGLVWPTSRGRSPLNFERRQRSAPPATCRRGHPLVTDLQPLRPAVAGRRPAEQGNQSASSESLLDTEGVRKCSLSVPLGPIRRLDRQRYPPFCRPFCEAL